MAKHIIFFNTKGGVGKSTLCEYSARELVRTGHRVQVQNTDQQSHVTLREHDNADFYLYDTMGAFSAENMALLEAAARVDALIVVPIGTGTNDFNELSFLLDNLKQLNLIDNMIFVFTCTRPKSKYLKERREALDALQLGLKHAKWVLPTLESFGQQFDTSRTRNEISQFINEVIFD